MNTIWRGAKNAFRNTLRTFSITLILGISIGLALIMLLANEAVSSKIESVKSSIGNTITINPAGARGFEGGGEPLTVTQIDKIRDLDHIEKIEISLLSRLITDEDTDLDAAIEAGTLGNRQGSFGARQFNINFEGGGNQGGNSAPTNFTLPITVTGISSASSLSGSSIAISEGEAFKDDSEESVAILGKDLAEKNKLEIGDSFKAFDKSVKVVGIFDAGNSFTNNSLYMPLKSLQTLSDQADEITNATIRVDSIDNLDATASVIKETLGEDKADVTTNEETSKQALTPLQNIKNISLYSLYGALIAGSVITLLIMTMIVRERRREIGVLKAIGASNATIVTQFVSESMVLTLFGSILGIILGFFLSNPVLHALTENNSAAENNFGAPQGFMAGGPGRGGFARVVQIGGAGIQNISANLNDISAVVDYQIILYGLGAAILIAIIGSALPAYLASKVRPAEIMKGE